jgi:VWFA-related protein
MITPHRAAPVLLTAMLVMTGRAQEPTFRAQSNVVTVPVLIKDDHGNAVYGLQAGDFIIEDDGIEQPARLDDASASEPISMVLALQCGRRASREFGRMRGLNALLSPIFAQLESQVALIEFDSQVRLVRDFAHGPGQLDDALQRMEPGDNGAAILDAVQYAVRLLDRSPDTHRRILLLISETRDHGSHSAKIQDVVAAVGNTNTVVYALSFSPSWSQVLDTERGSNKDEWSGSPDLLAPLTMLSQAMRKNGARAIAGMTGGEYELFSSRKGFERLMIDFTNHLHSRYLLSFEPKNPRPGLHQIRVRLKQPGKQTILARSSYWAEGSR